MLVGLVDTAYELPSLLNSTASNFDSLLCPAALVAFMKNNRFK